MVCDLVELTVVTGLTLHNCRVALRLKWDKKNDNLKMLCMFRQKGWVSDSKLKIQEFEELTTPHQTSWHLFVVDLHEGNKKSNVEKVRPRNRKSLLTIILSASFYQWH